jgi:hypothetical protein
MEAHPGDIVVVQAWCTYSGLPISDASTLGAPQTDADILFRLIARGRRPVVHLSATDDTPLAPVALYLSSNGMDVVLEAAPALADYLLVVRRHPATVRWRPARHPLTTFIDGVVRQWLLLTQDVIRHAEARHWRQLLLHYTGKSVADEACRALFRHERAERHLAALAAAVRDPNGSGRAAGGYYHINVRQAGRYTAEALHALRHELLHEVLPVLDDWPAPEQALPLTREALSSSTELAPPRDGAEGAGAAPREAACGRAAMDATVKWALVRLVHKLAFALGQRIQKLTVPVKAPTALRAVNARHGVKKSTWDTPDVLLSCAAECSGAEIVFHFGQASGPSYVLF